MSIKPIDMQVMMPRTNEVAKIHNDEHQRSASLQQQQAAATQHKVENTLKQVYSQDKVHEMKIREKNEKQRDGKRENRKNNDDPQNKKAKPAGSIDIRL